MSLEGGRTRMSDCSQVNPKRVQICQKLAWEWQQGMQPYAWQWGRPHTVKLFAAAPQQWTSLRLTACRMEVIPAVLLSLLGIVVVQQHQPLRQHWFGWPSRI